MRVAIAHETVYRYRSPANYSVQYLRLTPLAGPTQRILNWKISTTGRLTAWTDGFGNACHALVVDGSHDEVRVSAEGEVEIGDFGRPIPGEDEIHPPALFLRPTALTEPDESLLAFAAPFRKPLARDPRDGLDALMAGIRETVAYRPEATDATTPAAMALRQKAGVCQDHAHLFVSCCRSLGIPARYVSGYLCSTTEESAQMASHAWAEVWVDGTGWLSYDVTNNSSSANSHVRVAIGLDYLDAAPVRGFRRGGGAEEMRVDVTVGDAQAVREAREKARRDQQQ